jgi:hypothetical protein
LLILIIAKHEHHNLEMSGLQSADRFSNLIKFNIWLRKGIMGAACAFCGSARYGELGPSLTKAKGDLFHCGRGNVTSNPNSGASPHLHLAKEW